MFASKVHTALRILLAIDGSEHSLAGAELIRNLPLAAGSQIMAMAVLTPRHTPGRAALQSALDKTQTILNMPTARVDTGFLHGHPAEELARFADDNKPDLVVVGAQGLRATLGILLGGVAQQVVEYARWPVLIVRVGHTRTSRVLLAIDGSSSSKSAIDFVARFPLPTDASLEVLHVLPPLPSPSDAAHVWPIMGGEVPPIAVQVPEDEALARAASIEEQQGQALVDEAVESLRASGIMTTAALQRGDAATETLARSKDHGADLIVVGSRGLSAIRGWWLGSVSRKLVHYALCSVLVVRSAHEAIP